MVISAMNWLERSLFTMLYRRCHWALCRTGGLAWSGRRRSGERL